MKTQDYKNFKNLIIKATDPKDPIWWAGFLWVDLTKRQATEIVRILETKPFIKDTVTFNGHEAVEIPSGLAIWKEQ